MLIKITTFNLSDETVISEQYLNLLYENKQQHLLKHLIWCANNNAGAQIINCKDSPLSEDQQKQKDYAAKRKSVRAELGINDKPVLRGTKAR